jgi:hypothetical protein
MRRQRHQRPVPGAGKAPPVAQSPPASSAQRLSIAALETALDDAIAASFPASDPPSWTTGTATVASPAALR